MTAAIFNEWLNKCDNVLDNNIILLVDSWTTHSVSILLENIELCTFLPIQPCDQEIIKTLKSYYHLEMLSRILLDKFGTENKLAKKITLVDALHLLAVS